MKRILLLVPFLLITACSHEEWRKPGQTPAMVAADRRACSMEAEVARPAAMGLDIDLNSSYNSVRTTDVNARARQDYFDDCMMMHGWDLVRVPN